MSRNPFAALAGDDDISEGGDIALPKQSKPTQIDAAPPKSGAPKSGAINNATTRRHIPGQSVRPQKEARELPASDAPAGSQAQFDGERGRDDRGTGFGRGRGGGRGRGERGSGRGGPRGAGRGGRGERPDRRSQTGREDSAKAEHQGWGGDEGKRELEAETAGLGDAAAEAKEGGDDAAAAKPAETNGEKAAAVEEAATPAEPEDNSVTYEEYLKQRQAANIPGVQQVAARKANEGADEAQWKDGVAIEKKEQDPFFAIEGAQKEKARKEKARKEKQFLEVEFTPPARQERGGERGGRGGRGGRGRGEGAPRGRGADSRGARGGRGAPRGGRSAGGANINVDDNKAFPSLA